MTQKLQEESTSSNGSVEFLEPGSTLERSRKGSLTEMAPQEGKKSTSGRSYSDLAGESARVRRARKKVGQALVATGVPEGKIPEMFLDKEVARSRKGKAGQIVVHSLGGIHKNAAARTAQRFEHDLTSGREDIIEKLDAAGNLSQSLERLKEFMLLNPRWSFARAVAESKADLATAIDAYARGAIALNKLHVVMALGKEMPALMRDILRHAIDQETDCTTCLGIGMVKQRVDSVKCTLQCPTCRGSGRRLTSSEHKQFALQKALELARVLPEKAPLVAVQQNNQTVLQGAGLLEKMSKAADEILYNRREVIEAEIVKEKEYDPDEISGS